MYIETHWEWKTHQPLIQLMMTSFKPQLVVELGMGFNSTSLFLSYQPQEYIGIDNDKAWLELVQSKFTFKPEYKVLLHDLGDPLIVNTTSINVISNEQRFRNFLYYQKLRQGIEKGSTYPRLLFVDNFACLRSQSIKVLHEAFDIILYHDCQPDGVKQYGYYFQDIIDSGFEFYILKSPISWTGCLLRPELDFTQTELKGNIHRFIRIFELINKIEGLYLEKQ